MATKTIETRTSICAVCGEPISISVIVGEQKWHEVFWLHDRDPQAHDAVPELRVAVDATCPGCDYPEIGYAPQRAEFVCSSCGHTQDTRPGEDEPDGAPCCPDPECNGSPCTFPGYAANH